MELKSDIKVSSNPAVPLTDEQRQSDMASMPPGVENSGSVGSYFSINQQPAYAPGFDSLTSSYGVIKPKVSQPLDSSIPMAPPSGRKTLYVSNLHPSVTDTMLTDVFAVSGRVKYVQVISDINSQSADGTVYGFVEFEDSKDADNAIHTFTGRKLLDKDMKVNWAHVSQIQPSENNPYNADPQKPNHMQSLSGPFHLFVGNLSSSVTEDQLRQIFLQFGPSLFDVRIIWDNTTGRSKGYGFISYKTYPEAERALNTMKGQNIADRAVNVSWANAKVTNQPLTRKNLSRTANRPRMAQRELRNSPSYVSPENRIVYLGNIPQTVSRQEILHMFNTFGYPVEVKLQSDRGFGFVTMDSHEAAARAIQAMNGKLIYGRPIKVTWGKRGNEISHTNYYNAPPGPYQGYMPPSVPVYDTRYSPYPTNQYPSRMQPPPQQHAAPSQYMYGNSNQGAQNDEYIQRQEWRQY